MPVAVKDLIAILQKFKNQDAIVHVIDQSMPVNEQVVKLDVRFHLHYNGTDNFMIGHEELAGYYLDPQAFAGDEIPFK